MRGEEEKGVIVGEREREREKRERRMGLEDVERKINLWVPANIMVTTFFFIEVRLVVIIRPTDTHFSHEKWNLMIVYTCTLLYVEL